MRSSSLVALLVFAAGSFGQDAPRDRRLDRPKDYNGYFPWTPPRDSKEWQKRREAVREQTLVATGLWPLPPKTPLDAVVHGEIKRDGYVIKKVILTSVPGHYVTGNLYVPTAAPPKGGKYPAILNPHGHWNNGRFQEASAAEIDRELKSGAEKTREGAKHPLQAIPAGLARLGCVVFAYDMIGYADSQALKHRDGFKDVDAEMHLTSIMGLQTWNSIRALDFLISLPEVDATRIGVTGGSGGGTQTMILGAVDDRPAALFPAVMVSTSMQGGCVCENCSYLRIGTGNIELAALAAPRPLGMTAADDWTIEIKSKGLPELKTLYRLYGREDDVMAASFTQFKHNYNQVSREAMYAFFNKHLRLGHDEPIHEKPFVPATKAELSVFDETHPRPKDIGDVTQVRLTLKKIAAQQLRAVETPEELRKIVAPALRAMIVDSLPEASEVVEVIPSQKRDNPDWIVRDYVLSRKGKGEAVRAVGVCSQNFNGNVLVWVHPDGPASLWKDGQPCPAAKKWLDADGGILAVECFRTGATATNKQYLVNPAYAGYTFGYNRPILAERVHDILTAVSVAKNHKSTKSLSLVGFGEAGPWTVLAAGLCDGVFRKTAVDLNRFRFESVESMDDPMMLPGALRYGGLPTFTRLCRQSPLMLSNVEGTGCDQHAKNGQVRIERGAVEPVETVEWLLAK